MRSDALRRGRGPPAWAGETESARAVPRARAARSAPPLDTPTRAAWRPYRRPRRLRRRASVPATDTRPRRARRATSYGRRSPEDRRTAARARDLRGWGRTDAPPGGLRRAAGARG